MRHAKNTLSQKGTLPFRFQMRPKPSVFFSLFRSTHPIPPADCTKHSEQFHKKSNPPTASPTHPNYLQNATTSTFPRFYSRNTPTTTHFHFPSFPPALRLTHKNATKKPPPNRKTQPLNCAFSGYFSAKCSLFSKSLFSYQEVALRWLLCIFIPSDSKFP